MAVGDEGKPPRDVYPLVATHFQKLTADEQEARLENYPATRKWAHLVQWVRQRLVDTGRIDPSTRGVWKVTDSGRARLKAEGTTAKGGAASAMSKDRLSLRDLANATVDEVKSRLLAELRHLTSRAFEHFCREFLSHFGFRSSLHGEQFVDAPISPLLLARLEELRANVHVERGAGLVDEVGVDPGADAPARAAIGAHAALASELREAMAALVKR